MARRKKSKSRKKSKTKKKSRLSRFASKVKSKVRKTASRIKTKVKKATRKIKRVVRRKPTVKAKRKVTARVVRTPKVVKKTQIKRKSRLKNFLSKAKKSVSSRLSKIKTRAKKTVKVGTKRLSIVGSRLSKVVKRVSKKVGRSAKATRTKLRGAGRSIFSKVKKAGVWLGKKTVAGAKSIARGTTKVVKGIVAVPKKAGRFILGSVKKQREEIKEKGIIGKAIDDAKGLLFGETKPQTYGIEKQKKSNLLLLGAIGVGAYFLMTSK